jgi:uncharacterized protein (TIGR01777 family)
MRVFVTGATGLVGTRLVRNLLERGDQVTALSRRGSAARERLGEKCTVVEGDPMQTGAWMDAVRDCDGVVHLAGENIFARRWNADFKALLHDSRVKSTANLVQALSRNPRTAAGQAKVLVNASAIGFYGPHGDEVMDEDSPRGDDFLAAICVDWEHEARAAEALGVRVALIRVGLVLDKEGGALAKLLTPFKLCLGGPIGWTPWSGQHFVSWIHHADMVGLFLLGLDHAEARGPMNGTAPNPVTNREFGKAIGRALHRPAFMPTPPLALRLALGEVVGIIATGQRVVPKRPLALGYSFRFQTIDAALQEILS